MCILYIHTYSTYIHTYIHTCILYMLNEPCYSVSFIIFLPAYSSTIVYTHIRTFETLPVRACMLNECSMYVITINTSVQQEAIGYVDVHYLLIYYHRSNTNNRGISNILQNNDTVTKTLA